MASCEKAWQENKIKSDKKSTEQPVYESNESYNLIIDALKPIIVDSLVNEIIADETNIYENTYMAADRNALLIRMLEQFGHTSASYYQEIQKIPSIVISFGITGEADLNAPPNLVEYIAFEKRSIEGSEYLDIYDVLTETWINEESVVANRNYAIILEADGLESVYQDGNTVYGANIDEIIGHDNWDTIQPIYSGWPQPIRLYQNIRYKNTGGPSGGGGSGDDPTCTRDVKNLEDKFNDMKFVTYQALDDVEENDMFAQDQLIFKITCTYGERINGATTAQNLTKIIRSIDDEDLYSYRGLALVATWAGMDGYTGLS